MKNRQNPFQMVINEIKFVKGLTNFIFFVMIRLKYKRWSKTGKNVKITSIIRGKENIMDLITNIQKYSIHDGDGIRTTVFF